MWYIKAKWDDIGILNTAHLEVSINLLVRFTQGMDGLLGDCHENNYEMDHSLIPDLKQQ